MTIKEYLHNNDSSGLPSGQKRVVNDWSRRKKGKAGQDGLRDELRAVMPAYRGGGSVDWSKVPEERRRLVNGILSHKDVDWVRRALDKDREAVPDWEREGNVATHKLSVAGEGTEDNPYYIYAPVMTVDGKLVDTTDPRFGFGKYGNPDWAVERRDTVQVPDLDSGLWFTRHYKDILPFRYGRGGECEAARRFAEGGRTDGSPEPKALPYGPSLRLLKNLENPRGVGLRNGRYWPYSDGSQAFGLGTDILTNDTGRKLAAKARKEGIPAQQAHDIAVTELRKHDKAIMDSLEKEGYTTRPDTISLGPRLLAAQARYQRGNIRPIFKEWARAVVRGDGKKQKEIIGKYIKGQDRKNKVSTFDVYYGGWRTADDRKGITTKR